MKAVAYQQCLAIDEPNSLLDVELEKPLAVGRDCLVEVRAIAVNPVDVKVRASAAPARGEYKVIGWDASGVVTAVGEQVTQFRPGDEVWYAGAVNRPGCNAEYQLVDERVMALKPQSLSFSEAAALPLTSLTAWEILFDRLQIHLQPELAKQLLITGAAGGVGSIMIQLARAITATRIIATASRPESEDWVRSLGAHYVLNHRHALAEQLESTGLISVSHVASLNQTDQHFADLVKMLKPQGRLALIDSPSQPLDILSMKQKSLSLHWEFMFTRAVFTTDDMIQQHHILSRVAELVDNGVIRSTLQQHYGVINAENLKKAHRFIETNSSIGKVVLEGF